MENKPDELDLIWKEMKEAEKKMLTYATVVADYYIEGDKLVSSAAKRYQLHKERFEILRDAFFKGVEDKKTEE